LQLQIESVICYYSIIKMLVVALNFFHRKGNC
jgi:hypothetical protein